MSVLERLEELENIQAQKDLLAIKKQELIDSVITDAIKAQISEIEDEFEPQEKAVNDKRAEIESLVKSEVVQLGETVKGTMYQAVYVKGRTKWNDTGLMQYLSVHPEIAYLRTIGDPSVSIRKVG